MKENRKKSLFYKIYKITWAVLLILLVCSVFILRSYLADYEATRPEHVAQEMFDRYFASFDAMKLLSDTGATDSEFDTLEEMSRRINESLKGKQLSYSPASVGLDQTKEVYNVKYSEGDKDIKVATFTVKKSGEKSKRGFDKYELGDIELYCVKTDDIVIKVPTGYSVTLNGKAVGDKYITGEPIETESCNHMRDGAKGITYTLYTVSGLYGEPDIKVTTPKGEDSAVSLNENGEYEAAIVYSEELLAQFGERMIEAAKAYATFMQNDCTFRAVDPYFLTGSDIYNYIRTSQNMWVISHNSYYFKDESVQDFYEYADGVYSCRVKLTHVLKRNRMDDHVDYMDVTYYFTMSRGKAVVYASSNN